MDLNQIQLKPYMLADLYADTLLETGSAAAIPAPPPPLKFLGENKKKTVIIVAHPSVPVLPDGELAFLANVLAACKLGLADIAIVNFHNAAPAALQELLDTSAVNILLFGIEPLAIGLPINFPAFQLQQFSQRMYLHAPSLPELEQDKLLKQKLWNGLKNMFGL